jgi:quercetin dioxygenase-like cupin family protein
MDYLQKFSKEGFVELVPGVMRKATIYGKNTLLNYLDMEKGAAIPMHDHPEEQIGYLVSGHIVLIIGDDEYDVAAGDSYLVPGDMTHGLRVLEAAVAVEVFSPVRKQLLPKE